ncbi:MAG: pilus assembly protein PilC [Gammaproteobacteria bacterium]|nr:pilus assembly protein PilC [Gammaproteobacteria bacterium]
MPSFEYKGISGEKNTYADGVIEAVNEDEAAYRLRQKKIIITAIKEVKSRAKKEKSSESSSSLSFLDGFSSIKTKDVVLFTKKLSTMSRAGLPILDSLNMAKDQIDDKKLKVIASNIAQDLQGGTELSGCFNKHPKVFDNIYVNMIKAGESSGKLDIFLDKLVGILEKREKIKSKIKSALMYPTIILSVATLVTVFMIWKVVPVFEKMYGGMGVELPGPTKFLIGANKFITGSGGITTVAILLTLFFTHSYFIKNNTAYKSFMDKFSIRIPLFGNIIIQATIARIALIKANLFAAGVDVLEILDIAKSSTNNTHFVAALEQVKRGVFSGEDMSKLVEKEIIFPPTYSQLIAVGEKTGNLEEMFSSIASYYEEEFDNVVDNLSTMIEPLSMVIIGGIVGTLLIAMYMPIFNAGSVVG